MQCELIIDIFTNTARVIAAFISTVPTQTPIPGFVCIHGRGQFGSSLAYGT